MNEPSIRVRNLTKSFGGRRVVDGLSFDVEKGQVFALLGHNGAGKSTTIDLILGLKTPESGTAKILGMDAARNRKQVFERVGVQLQHTQYQSAITVEEACIEYASLYAAPADFRQLLESFGLNELRKSFVSKLSGGERQKLSVVLALIGNPELVFLDELTTGLDVVARREVWRTLKHLKEQGLTIFLTTHYMEEAEALCDRVCIIKSGKKVAEGSIDEVVAAAGQNNLEEAYLFFMGEEELL
ncbi:MAG: ABC transporter ATP-binding protein [bacterium]|nr:ABC transporter ATP-binding protein [bacterium]